MYHSIGENKALFNVSASDFSRQLEFLERRNWRVIPLAQLIEKLSKNEQLPDKTVVLTFDDGYVDNYINAWPLLKKYNFSATIFLPTAFIGQVMNNSQNRPLELMSEAQIKEMSASGLVDFGSHTHTHPQLKKISDDEFNLEIKTSKEIVERLTGKECRFFAYPKGYFRPSFIDAMKNNGFVAGLTVKEGLARESDNLFLLKRNFIYSAGGFNQFKGKLSYSVIIYNMIKSGLTRKSI